MLLYSFVVALLCASVHQACASQSKDEDDAVYNLTYFNFDNADGFDFFTWYNYGKTNFKKFTLTKDWWETGGPRCEHSTGSSLGAFYMFDVYNDLYLEYFTENYNVHNATMDTPSFPPADNYCIQFWYSLFGPEVHGIDVFIREDGGYGTPSWSKRGDQGEEWSLGQFELDSEYTYIPFKLEFVGYTAYYYSETTYSITENNKASNVAIDDLYVYNTKCSNIPLCPKNAVINTVDGVTSCYTVHTEPKAWKDAFDVCRRQGAKSGLVSIESQQEQDFLVNLIQGNANYAAAGESDGFWTSGNDLWKEGTWEWADKGYGVDFNYTNWHTRQPNNVAGKQNCLVLEYPDDSYTWGDERCESERPFICEVYYKSH